MSTNTTNPMNTQNPPTHELLEMASLDAMGLLDAEEREVFERAFRAAAPAVQAQLRREQLRFSASDDTLPQIDLPLGLRARVIAAVREAMGTASRRGTEVAPALRFPTGVSKFWRVGAIAALAASIVLGIATIWISNETKGLTEVEKSVASQKVLEREFGNRFTTTFMNPSTQFVSFVPATDAADSKGARAKLMFDPLRKQAQLFVQDLPSTDRDYEVVLIDKHGQSATAILSFKALVAGLTPQTISNFDMENAKQLIIRVQGSDKPLLKSDGI